MHICNGGGGRGGLGQGDVHRSGEAVTQQRVVEVDWNHGPSIARDPFCGWLARYPNQKSLVRIQWIDLYLF